MKYRHISQHCHAAASVFKASLDRIEDIKGKVTVSVSENFLCKGTRQSVTEEAKIEAMKATIV
jgi:hypothetical protein